MKWTLLDSLAVIAGIAGFICIPVALFVAIKGFVYDPLGWIRLAFGAFVVVYLLQLAGARS